MTGTWSRDSDSQMLFFDLLTFQLSLAADESLGIQVPSQKVIGGAVM